MNYKVYRGEEDRLTISSGYLPSTANRVRALACSISGDTEIQLFRISSKCPAWHEESKLKNSRTGLFW